MTGILVKPGDPKALADGINLVIDNPELADQIRQKGREEVRRYSWDQLAIDLNERIVRFEESKWRD